jgi:hypothetical protein
MRMRRNTPMLEAAIAGAGGLLGLYVAIRREVRRSYELLQKDIGHLQADNGRFDRSFTEVRADIRRVDEKIDAVRGELIGFLGSR